MIDEVTLFLKGIKQGLLISKNHRKINLLKSKGFYMREMEEGFLITRTLEEQQNNLLGVVLGYYPKSVEKFIEEKANRNFLYDNGYNVFLNYNGIHFNVMGYFEEALEWCHKIYREKMEKEFGKVDVFKITLTKENGNTKLSYERVNI